jgi:hypothetical protein
LIHKKLTFENEIIPIIMNGRIMENIFSNSYLSKYFLDFASLKSITVLALVSHIVHTGVNKYSDYIALRKFLPHCTIGKICAYGSLNLFIRYISNYPHEFGLVNILSTCALVGNLDILIYLANSKDLRIYSKIILLDGAKSGQLNVVRYAMDNYPLYSTLWLAKAIQLAAENGKIEVLNYLIDYYVPNGNYLPVFWDRQINIVWYMHLMKKGFYDYHDEAESSSCSANALVYACDKGHLDVVHYLVKNGVNALFLNNLCLEKAASHGFHDIVVYLIESGSNVNLHCKKVIKCLMKKMNYTDVLNFLIKHGLNQESLDNMMIYHATNGDLNGIKLMVEKGANIHAKKNLALKISAKYGNIHIMQYLINMGANYHLIRRYGLEYDVIDVLNELDRLEWERIMKHNEISIYECEFYPRKYEMQYIH